MREHLRQTAVLTERRARRKHTEQTTTKKEDAAYEAMVALAQACERQEEARLLYQQKCEEAAEAETLFNGTIKDTVAKAEALEKHGYREIESPFLP